MLQPDDYSREELLQMLERLLLNSPDPSTRSALQNGMRRIMSLPLEEQQQALSDLVVSYSERRDDLRTDLETSFALATQPSPRGQVAGNNQFSVYVGANPLEHIGSAITKYKAGKEYRKTRGELDKLSEREEGAQRMLMEAQRDALLGMGGDNDGPPPGVTYQQWQEWKEQERLRRLYGPRGA